MRRRFAKAVEADSTWIASSEHIGAWLRHPNEVGALSEFLGEFFADVTLVTVIRRSDYWLPSSYVESVKAGGVRPLDEDFVRRRRGALVYSRYVRRWGGSLRLGQHGDGAVPRIGHPVPDSSPIQVLASCRCRRPDITAVGVPGGAAERVDQRACDERCSCAA